MQIDYCTDEDLTACADLLAEVYAEEPYNENWTKPEAISYLSRFLRIEPDGCFIAREDTLIGAIFSYTYPWHKNELIYIQELFVSPSYRRRGIATELLKAVGKGKTARAWLVANERSKAAEFYQAMGFSQKGPYKFYNGTICT